MQWTSAFRGRQELQQQEYMRPFLAPQLGQLLRDIRSGYHGQFITCRMLRLAPTLFQQPG
jgi:hypothetical protein